MSGFDEGFGADDEHVQFVTVQLEEVRLHPGFYFSEAVGECGVSIRGDGFGGNVELDVAKNSGSGDLDGV